MTDGCGCRPPPAVQALAYLSHLESSATASGQAYDYVMHADDDSFVRLDLLLPLMVSR